MFSYLINSFRRKIARRYTKRYPVDTDTIDLKKYGTIRIIKWKNPLVKYRKISVENADFFYKFLKEGDFAIDIGANTGSMTMLMSLVTGKTGLTLSFDPNPYVYEILVQNAKLNPGKTNIKPYNFAITGSEGDFFYNSSEASFNNGGISEQQNNRHGKFSLEHKIKGIKLETFLEEKYPDRINRLKLIKIDTEGYDKEIIRSVSNLLTKFQPAVITECFFRTTPEDRFEQFDLLKSKGYSLYYFSEFSINAEIVPIKTKEEMLKWKHFDLYAIIE
jgi:FkbM family methyltransferase